MHCLSLILVPGCGWEKLGVKGMGTIQGVGEDKARSELAGTGMKMAWGGGGGYLTHVWV